MALTIQQLQTFIDTNPDLRQLVNEVVDYLQANPSGGGGATPTLDHVLASGATLTANRNIDLDGHVLMFTDDDGDNELLRLEPKGVSLLAKDVFSTVQINMTANDGVNTTLQLRSDLSPTDESEIILDGAISQITHTGKVHIFNAGGDPYLSLNSGIFQSTLKADDGTAFSSLVLNANLSGNSVKFLLEANDDSNAISIEGDAQAQTITIVAANGVILDDLAGGGTTGLSIDNTGKLIRTP